MNFLKGLKSLLAQNYSFWIFKNWFNKHVFKIKSFISSKEYWWNEESQKSRNLIELIKLSIWLVIISLVISAILLGIQLIISSIYSISLPHVISDENYITLLGTISGISGVFIGLYFTAISVVASTSYTRVPNNIRRLLNRERTGNVYIRFLSILTFVCIVLIGFNLLGLPKIEFAIIPLVLFSGVGIFVFSILGKGIFNLFDPTTLSNILFEEEFNLIKKVSSEGRNWLNPSFQDYYRKKSVQFLDTLENLSSISQQEEHLKEEPLEGLAENFSKFLSFYVYRKNAIPPDSKWFAPRYEQKDWFLTSGFEVTSALRTGTQLSPNQSSDKYYIENRLEKIIKNFIRSTLEDSEYEIATTIITNTSYYIKTLCEYGELERAFRFVISLNSEVLNHICNIEGEVKTKESDKILGILDTINLIPINMLLSFHQQSSLRDYQYFKDELRKINWKDKRSVYKTDFGFYLNERLEWLYKTLSFEIKVESNTVSPLWYQTELLLQEEASLIHDSINLLLDLSSKFYDDSFEKLIEAEKFLFASPYLSRKIEFTNKLYFGIDQLIKNHKQISDKRSIEGLPWKEIDQDKLQAEFKKTEPILSKQIAKLGSYLIVTQNRGASPDYLGQFSSYLLDYAFYCFSENKTDILKEIFPSTFFCNLFKHQELISNPSIEEWQLESHLLGASKPLVELMQLSGYGYLFSYMYENDELKELIDNAWDNYITSAKNIDAVIKKVHHLINHTDSSLRIFDKNILSQNWQNEVARILSSIESETFSESGMSFARIEIPMHESPIVRAYYPKRGHYSLGYDGIDLFLYTYMEHIDREIDFSLLGFRRNKQFDEQIDIEVELYMKYILNEESDT